MKKQFNFFKILFLLIGLGIYTGATAQERMVTGIVTDADTGGPLPGVTVVKKGTFEGVITQVDGTYSIEVTPNDVLVFSFVGYKSIEEPVGDREVINVALAPDVLGLEEVVVIGYGTVKKEDLTGSVTAVDASKLNRGLATSPSDLISGKVAGVSVVSSGGAPGAGATIRIRGGSSMSASNDPLIVIDGVPVDNSTGINGMADPLSSIHPNDIKTFTVLKDASATAIYGSRASNGVIIITTKEGSKGKMRVSYNGNFAVSTKRGTVDVMGADEFRQYVTDLFGAGSEQVAALGDYSTDWQEEIFQTALSTDHNISFSGSLKDIPYRVSVGYTSEEGILKTSKMERTTGALNLSPKFLDNRLSVKLNVKGVYNTNRFADTGAIGSATQFDPTQPIYADSPYGNGYYMSLKEDGTPIDIGLANPVAVLEQKEDESTVYRSIGNAQIDYKFLFLDGLNANLNVGYDVSKSDGDVIYADNSPMSYVWGNNKAGWGENSSYSQTKENYLLDFYLNYNRDFAAHHFDVMGGYSWQKFYRDEENEYPYSAEKALETDEEFYKDGYDYSTESYVISFFGRLNYNYAQKYFVTFSLRNDGSSRFSPDNQWGLFPSAALAWKISNESFLEGSDVVSDLKLRLSYGVTGQQSLGQGDYPWMGRYSYSTAGANYYFGDTIVRLLRPLAYDENLKWEETTTYNVGVDYGFLGNRISGTLDFYYRETEDLLNTVAIPAGTNFSNQLLTNVGELTNKGVEFSITGRPLAEKDFSWILSYNIAYNKNEIKKLTINDDPDYVGVEHGGIDGGTGNNILIHQVGQPAGSFYVFEQVYDESGKPVEGAYVDQNGDGEITEQDRIAYKKADPDFIMGLSSQLNYKNWDFNFSLRSHIGNYAYNNVQSNREAHNTIYDPSGFLKNRVTSAKYTDFENVRYRSSYYVQEASFLKMDNISLGYTFDNLGLWGKEQMARVSFTVENPFVITDYDGLDPEFGNDGIDNNIYPNPRVFIIGLSLNF
ncbi:SusC/RagA family TonB-linked outer membrane protein [Thermophagus xiamenensis]|uniref:Iron complex outermembrane recepter protein n=1 Tax=Thermophagus xiamenensis TaxID=385682 RepID=A0A1I2AAH1_9BACT|nr:TonB-dependent receptor [Thermophagus xiamenensis]SFE40862.1 iron complex outermembrane recepter protein [Thermophagus xiamenensis]